MKTALIYCRISRDAAGTALGVQRQESACRELCEGLGLDVVEVLVDNDISAYSGKPRPGWREATERIKSGHIDTLVAWHPDRLTRRPRELEDLIDLLDRTDTKVRTVQAGEYDLSTASGRTTARIVGAIARGESEHKSDRIRAAQRQMMESGRGLGGGIRPFGFADDRIKHVPEEADAIRWAASEIIGGASLRSVVARMPVLTVKGAKWSPHVLRELLLRGRVAGLVMTKGEIIGPAEWPPILDRETWERVRNVLTDPARKKWRPSTRYLLTGGLVRDCYGREMFARPSAGNRRCYITLRDHLGPGVVIDAAGLEADVIETVRAVVKDWRPSPPTKETTVDVRAIEDEMRQLAELRRDDVITLEQFLVLQRPLRDRLEAARAELGPVRVDVDPRPLAERWDELDIMQQRKVTEAVVEFVVVMPAVAGRNFYDFSRVVIVHRGAGGLDPVKGVLGSV